MGGSAGKRPMVLQAPKPRDPEEIKQVAEDLAKERLKDQRGFQSTLLTKGMGVDKPKRKKMGSTSVLGQGIDNG